MAQACVMVQPDLECGPHQQCMLTPTRPTAGAHVDTSLITSSVRKRKDLPNGKQSEKRCRSEAATPATSEGGQLQSPHLPQFHPALLSPQAQHPVAHRISEENTAPPHEHVEAVGADEVDGTLFSPTFHLGTQEQQQLEAQQQQQGHKASRPSTPPAEGTSTDNSTGTSTSVEIDVRAVASPGAVIIPVQQQQQPQQPEQQYDDDELEFDPFVFIKRLPPLEKCFPKRTSFLLPRQTRRSKQKTLVLDLDETLVHSTLDGDCNPDFTFPVDVGSIRHMVAVRKRPHLHAFLHRVSQLYEVVVFTASQRVYAEQLLDLVDPGRQYIRHRVYRESCVLWEGNYLKDLTVLGRDLAHTLIIDNSPQAFGFQLDNGVPIESWYDDHEDEELLRLLPFLEAVADVDDVRPHIQSKFKLRRLVEMAPGPMVLRLGRQA